MQEASGQSTTPTAARTISCKAWNTPAEYPSWVARCDIKGSDCTMLNPIFWKKVQRQKHPGRSGIVEHQIPSINVLFKTNTKSHKHPGIKLLSSESKTQLVNQRKQKVAFNPRTAHSPKIQSYRMWWSAASPILNDTPVVCIYTSYNRPVVNGMERMCQRHGSDQTPTLLFESKNHVSINSYSITYALEEFLLSIIPNSVIVWSLQ